MEEKRTTQADSPPPPPGPPDGQGERDRPGQPPVKRPSALVERMRRVNPDLAKQYRQKPGQ